MRRLAVPVLMLLALAACGSQGHPVPAPGEVRAADPRAPGTASRSDAAALESGNSRFAGRLLAVLARTQPTVALSPFSISDALAMTYAGARGQTAAEMARTLDFPLRAERLQAAFNSLAQKLGELDTGTTDLRIAGALFGQQGTAFRQAFLRALARDYGTGIRTVDFARAADVARLAINDWVSRATDRKIAHLLHPGDVDALTRLVLADAVYLSARWSSPFSRQDTSPEPFHAPGSTVQVPTMHQTATFGYRSHPGYRVLELPYKGGGLAFDVLLPDPGQLPSLLALLARAGPLQSLSGLEPQRVRLSLPKILLRTRFQLSDSLAGLGMPLAFARGRADFSGIAGAPGDLHLQRVVHEAYIQVDEAGTKAAATTAAVISITALAPMPAIAFDVNRPFVFVLRDTATGAILFLGVVSRP